MIVAQVMRRTDWQDLETPLFAAVAELCLHWNKNLLWLPPNEITGRSPAKVFEFGSLARRKLDFFTYIDYYLPIISVCEFVGGSLGRGRLICRPNGN